MKKLFFFLLVFILSSCKDDDFVRNIPNQNNSFKVSKIGKYLQYPVFSENGNFYGSFNYLYNKDNVLTEYDFNKVNDLLGFQVSPRLRFISNEGIPYYSNESQSDALSFYFDQNKEPHIIGKEIGFSIYNINKDGIVCGVSKKNAINATIINTKNNKILNLSNPYNVSETGKIITNPINNIFSVYGRTYAEEGERLCKWDVLINPDGTMKELTKTIINANDFVDIESYSNSNIYGTFNKNFVKISSNNEIQEYNDTNHPGTPRSQALYNEIKLNNNNYGVGMITVFSKYRAPVFVNLKSKSITPIQDFVQDSLLISNEEKSLINSIGEAFYFASSPQQNSIILSGGSIYKSIKLDLISK